MNPKVLLVDDDESVLMGYQRNLRRRFELQVATSGDAALQLLDSSRPFAVIVVDMLMPGMNGLDLLQRVGSISPHTCRIMLTGAADQKTAVDAVNHGQVFRFLPKPCSIEDLTLAIEGGARQFELIRAEKELLEKTLSGAVEAMTDLLSSLSPQSFGLSQILKERSLKVAAHLKLDHEWEVGLSALLSSIGYLTIPPRILQKVQTEQILSPEERSLLRRAPEFGARLLRRIPRLDEIADGVHFQSRGFDGSGFPEDGPSGKAIPIAARILKPLADMLKAEHRALSPLGALAELQANAHLYDPEILAAVIAITEAELGLPQASPPQSRPLLIRELEEGQVLASRVSTASGKLVLFPGIRLSVGHIQMLHNLSEILDLQEPIHIREDPPEATRCLLV